MPVETILVILVILAGFYMAWNIGANDVANAMGTSVGSGALTLRQAVIVAAILEFSGAFFFGSHVSETIQKGIVETEIFAGSSNVLVFGMLSSLAAAGVWLQVASYYGWPVSTTHTIVGAIVGFGVVAGGFDAVYWENVSFIVSSWILSPFVGGILSYLIFTVLRKNIFYVPDPLEATKRITPYLVFFVISTLSLILLISGLKNLQLNLTFFQSFLLSLSLGIIGFFISSLLVKKMKAPPPKLKHAHPSWSSALANDFRQAKNQMLRLQADSPGEVQYHISTILDEIDNIEYAMQHPEEPDQSHTDYQAVEKIFGYLQIMSACLMAFAHGANDVANAIGPLSAAITVISTGIVTAHTPVPTWTLALGGFGIVVGLATWGWRVIETIGKKITELTPSRGFAAEFGAALTIVFACALGLPISTTHTLVGSVLGVGLARGIEALNLGMTRDILISWLVTVPAGAVITVFFFYILKAIFI